MAKIVIIDATLSLGGTDYSEQVKSITLTIDVDTPEVTNMESLGWKELLPGLKGWQLSVDFVKDADLSGLDAAMTTALLAGSLVAMLAKHRTGTVSTSIAEWQGNLLINQWTPLGNAVGEPYGASYTWQGTGALTRDVTP